MRHGISESQIEAGARYLATHVAAVYPVDRDDCRREAMTQCLGCSTAADADRIIARALDNGLIDVDADDSAILLPTESADGRRAV